MWPGTRGVHGHFTGIHFWSILFIQCINHIHLRFFIIGFSGVSILCSILCFHF